MMKSLKQLVSKVLNTKKSSRANSIHLKYLHFKKTSKKYITSSFMFTQSSDVHNWFKKNL